VEQKTKIGLNWGGTGGSFGYLPWYLSPVFDAVGIVTGLTSGL